MPLSLHHIALSVKNLEESNSWYEGMLGFSIEKVFEMPNEGKFCFLTNGIVRLELFCFLKSEILPEYRTSLKNDLRVQGTKHICFEVADIQKAFEEFQKKGCAIASEPKLGFSGGKYFFIQDPTGNLIELYQHNSSIPN